MDLFEKIDILLLNAEKSEIRNGLLFFVETIINDDQFDLKEKAIPIIEAISHHLSRHDVENIILTSKN